MHSSPLFDTLFCARYLEVSTCVASDIKGDADDEKECPEDRADNPFVAHSYTLVSGNDEPSRDPTAWVLQAQASGGDAIEDAWVVVDMRKDQTFSERLLPQLYTVRDPGMYSRYRLVILNVGAPDRMMVQLSEFTLSSQPVSGATCKCDMATKILSRPL